MSQRLHLLRERTVKYTTREVRERSGVFISNSFLHLCSHWPDNQLVCAVLLHLFIHFIPFAHRGPTTSQLTSWAHKLSLWAHKLTPWAHKLALPTATLLVQPQIMWFYGGPTAGISSEAQLLTLQNHLDNETLNIISVRT